LTDGVGRALVIHSIACRLDEGNGKRSCTVEHSSLIRDAAVEQAMWRLYREYFDQAERRRRWSIEKDIPWSACSTTLSPAIADVVESFCAIELYLPDYLKHAMIKSRPSRARTWFYANWGYEESKHSLALGEWLIRSGQRTPEQMADVEGLVFAQEYNLPHESVVGMLAYAMVQERATALNYRNLRRRAIEFGGDPALEKLLVYISVDEQSHHSFFQHAIQLYLDHDPESTLDQLRHVMNGFTMPAIHGLFDGRARVARIKELRIFDEDQYYREIYLPILEALGIERARMRNPVRVRKSVSVESK
jgi:acyl-[acyl-carrier-protein] desaturase